MRGAHRRRAASIRYLPGRFGIVLGVLATAGVWLVLLAALVSTALVLPRIGWSGVMSLVLVCGTPLPAWWATRQVAASRRVRSRLPAALLAQRSYGHLVAPAPHETRALRPVGTDAVEVARRTDALLAPLTTIPSVRIFRDVRPSGAPRPVATHAVSAGRLLVLVESVAWPPGAYQVDPAGRVCCDGLYIGQSVHALCGAIRHCKLLLPRSHRVCALVVVHRTAGGGYTLPAATREVDWAIGDDLPAVLRGRLSRHPFTVSRHTVAALTDLAR